MMNGMVWGIARNSTEASFIWLFAGADVEGLRTALLCKGNRCPKLVHAAVVREFGSVVQVNQYKILWC